MDTSLDFDAIRADLDGFGDFLFDGIGYRTTRENLTLCVEARLAETRRKTHQPAGAALARSAAEADGLRQRMNRVTLAAWSDELVRTRLLEVSTRAITAPQAWIVDDTGFEKKGRKSPGVQRQYCGTAGKVTNCQLVVSTHLASYNASLPADMDVYLPKGWCDDDGRRSEAGIPDDVRFRTKPELALEQLDRLADATGLRLPVLADAGYGHGHGFRDALRERGMTYIVGVTGDTGVWWRGEGPDAPEPKSTGLGRPRTRALPGQYQPVSVEALASMLPSLSYVPVKLRRGRHATTKSRFAFVRIRTAHRAHHGEPPGEEEWLIIEWPADAEAPTHYYLSNLPKNTRRHGMAELAKLRWRVERDYQDLKQEVGLDHYEGRRWQGLNHHLTICMAAFVFLAIQRRLFPPEGPALDGIDPS
jgi:SRSO17 transposase